MRLIPSLRNLGLNSVCKATKIYSISVLRTRHKVASCKARLVELRLDIARRFSLVIIVHRMSSNTRFRLMLTRLHAHRYSIARGGVLFPLHLMPQARHLPRIHQNLIDRGPATWIGEGDPTARTDIAKEIKVGIGRILALIDRLFPGAARR